MAKSRLNRQFAGKLDAKIDRIETALVAQLDRASDYGSEGWGFESLRAHQIRSFPRTVSLELTATISIPAAKVSDWFRDRFCA